MPAVSRRSKPAGVFTSLMVLAGAAVFFVAGLYVHRSYSPYPGGLSATGTTTGIRSSESTRGKTMYTAVYTFTTTDGRVVSFEDPASSSSRPEQGARVEVSYRPAAPELARRVPGFDWWGWLILGASVLIGMSGLFSLVRAVARLAGRVRAVTLP